MATLATPDPSSATRPGIQSGCNSAVTLRILTISTKPIQPIHNRILYSIVTSPFYHTCRRKEIPTCRMNEKTSPLRLAECIEVA